MYIIIVEVAIEARDSNLPMTGALGT